jgi:tripartite-type tricarboxylate transporter receptor subunit TctC
MRVTGFRRSIADLAGLAVLGVCACAIGAERYPSKPIRCIVNASPGGAPDIIARALGQKLTESTGQQVVVDARPGAGGAIAGELAARAPADGYTVVLAGAAMFGALPATRTHLPFDPFRDFAPITLVGESPNIVVVNPLVPAKSVAELIQLAKTKPLLYASTGTLTPSHLAGELLNTLAGLSITHVPYKGAGPALSDLIAGQVHLLITTPVSALPHVTSGRLRALAVTSRARSSAFPDLPVVADTVPGYEITQWFGLLVPVRTPAAVQRALYEEALKALRAPDLRDRFAAQGITPGGGTPGELAAHMLAELARTRNIVHRAGIPVDK